MELTTDSLKSFKKLNEAELWDLAATLLQLQDIIVRLEDGETDPRTLKILAERALSAGRELDAVLATLEEITPDE